MPPAVIEILDRVSAELDNAISRFQPERTRASAITPEEVAALRKEIRYAANCLRQLPHDAELDPELKQRLTIFRHHLERLRLALPALHTHLLTEHARLSEAQIRCNAAVAWIQANHETL
jgi:hypothetical protein